MRVFFVIGSALFSASYANLLASTASALDPTITPAPEIPLELLRKQNDARFMGWLSLSGTWTSRRCDIGGTLYQSGEFWRCCATTVASCNVPVGCISGSLIYSFTSGTVSRGTYGCTEIYTESEDQSFTICNTGFLYENTLDSDPRTNVFCGISSVNWSYYREKPAESTSTPEPSSTPSSTSRFISASATSSNAASSQTSLSSPQPQKKESKAWIAGAVVGPVVGLAILGALLWFCLVKRKKETQPQQPPSAVPPSYAGSPKPQYPQPYQNYPPQMQQNQHGMVPAPYGVAAVKPDSWIHTPQSPHSHASTSPHPPSSPYGPPPGQQWQQPTQQANNPQNLHPQQSYPQMGNPQTSPTMSPQQPQGGYVDDGAVIKPSHNRPFSSELDGTSYQQPEYVLPPQQQAPR